MLFQYLLFAILPVLFLATSYPESHKASTLFEVALIQSQTQISTVQIPREALKNSLILSIASLDARLQGRVLLNGKVIRTLRNSQNKFNLAPYLKKEKINLRLQDFMLQKRLASLLN